MWIAEFQSVVEKNARCARTFVPIAIPQAGFARHFGPQWSDRNRRFETIRVKLDDVVYYVFLILVILCLS